MAAALEEVFLMVTNELHTGLAVPGQKGNMTFLFDFQNTCSNTKSITWNEELPKCQE